MSSNNQSSRVPYTKSSFQLKNSNVKKVSELEGKPPLDKKILLKYNKGSSVNVGSLRHGYKKHYFIKKEIKYREAEESAARAEILLTEAPGLLEAKETSYTSHIHQREIRKAVDITSATKSFDLKLNQFGPYKFGFSRNGRHMVLGGRKGHLASFDWVTKKLATEINVNESIHDVCFLHNEQMMAVAQKNFTYVYDNQGIELHCLKSFHRILKLEFLPYHFLLCSGSESGFLCWLDITLGKEVLQFPTRKGRLDVMCQNPMNAVICCGHNNGTVTMWTPNTKKPVFSMLCHPQGLRSIAVDPTGRLLATACVDRTVRLWDTRNLGKVTSSYKLGAALNNLAFSQTKLLGVSFRNVVEVYKDIAIQDACEIYMRHEARSMVTGLQFCPYEDVLGCSLSSGYTSLLIPGAGEPNFDALEANPFRSVAARRESEVKSLLEKIPYDLITLDVESIAQVDVPTLEEKLEAKKKLHWVKVPKVNVQPRYRMKGKSGSAQKFKRKLKVQEGEKRDYLKFIKEKKIQLEKEEKTKQKPVEQTEILDRFKPKRKKS